MIINVLSILLGVFGQALIIAGFLLFCGKTPTNILWLDITVTSVVFWLLATTFGLRPIDMADRSQRQVGGLGLRWYTTIMYSVLAIGLMAFCGIYALCGNGYIAFKWQLMGQLGLLFLFLLGMLSSMHAAQKTGEVFRQEHRALRGKEEIQYTFSDLSYRADSNPEIPSWVRQALSQLTEEVRYLTPSSNFHAIELDDSIFEIANRLRGALTGPYEMNRQEIEQLLPELQRNFSRRKQFI